MRKQNINEFKSVKELLEFQRNYSVTNQEIISNNTFLIEQERNFLSHEIDQFNDFIRTTKTVVEEKLRSKVDELKEEIENLYTTHSSPTKRLVADLKKIALKIKIQFNKLIFDYKIKFSIRDSVNILTKKRNRHQYITSNFTDAVNESSLIELQELQRKKKVIDEIESSIYGALGEQKVVKELENLSDDFFLINDFTCSFEPPIYNRKENDYIKSVQIDHILISPSGIFLIETKNWSEQSLNNLSLRSPVQQILRTSFALYKLLNGEISKLNSPLKKHHWGHRQVTIKSLIVFINQKPKEEFQFVKILTLKELVGFVKYFKPTFSKDETQAVATYLLAITNRNG